MTLPAITMNQNVAQYCWGCRESKKPVLMSCEACARVFFCSEACKHIRPHACPSIYNTSHTPTSEERRPSRRSSAVQFRRIELDIDGLYPLYKTKQLEGKPVYLSFVNADDHKTDDKKETKK